MINLITILIYDTAPSSLYNCISFQYQNIYITWYVMDNDHTASHSTQAGNWCDMAKTKERDKKYFDRQTHKPVNIMSNLQIRLSLARVKTIITANFKIIVDSLVHPNNCYPK